MKPPLSWTGVAAPGQILGVAVAGPEMEPVLLNPDRPFAMASVAKLIIAVAALRTGRPVADELVLRAVSHHDGQATGALMEAAGGEAEVNAWLSSSGWGTIRVAADNRSRTGNIATPRALHYFVSRLVAGQLLDGGGLALVRRALIEQVDPDGLLSGLSPGSRWLHMTGGMDGVCNDVGILVADGREYICAVLAEADPDGDWSQLERTVGRVGSAIQTLTA